MYCCVKFRVILRVKQFYVALASLNKEDSRIIELVFFLFFAKSERVISEKIESDQVVGVSWSVGAQPPSVAGRVSRLY